MPLEKSNIHKILVNSLTNIGDVILTFPVIDILKRDFPRAELSVIIGPKAVSLLQGNPQYKCVYVFNKHQSPKKTIPWILQLRKERFDLMVDLRNSAIPIMISPKYRTSFFMAKTDHVHMRDKHLNRLRQVYAFENESAERFALHVSQQDRAFVAELIRSEIGKDQPFVVVAPGAAHYAKRWSEKEFAALADALISQRKLRVVFVGDQEDRPVVNRITGQMSEKAVDLCDRTNLIQLAELINHATLIIANDSAPMHLASYLAKPVLAIFSYTDPQKYGPWSSQSIYLKRNEHCPACRDSLIDGNHTCIDAITHKDVLKSFALKNGRVVFTES